ncbi:MAG: fumarylacetoacetate hydrolase family protein [Bacteroidota bacterium]
MKKIIQYTGLASLLLFLVAALCFLYLNRGLPHEITPAQFTCLSLEDGDFVSFDTLPRQIYGIGLSYAGHINETASSFDPAADPPVFRKALGSIAHEQSKVPIPSHTELVQAVDQLEPGLAQRINASNKPLPALMDYEVELGFVLLEDIDLQSLNQADYVPKIGFFITNDLSARSLAVLGEGQPNRHDYWGVSKSFQGFTPVSQQVWVPREFQADAIPCISLQTTVNGAIRQKQKTSDMIYTPLQMLQAVQRKYPATPLKKGDWVLMGTPGGVVMSTPRWIVRVADMMQMDRFEKLKHKTGESDIAEFLQQGDKVVSSGEGLGKVTVEIISQ